jgi:hypothetical protein
MQGVRRAFTGLVLATTVFLVGCAGSTSTPATAGGPPAPVGGRWAGSAGVGAVSTPVTLSLTQIGNAVTGDISVGGRPDLSGPVVGTVQDRMISLELRNGYGSLPDLTVSQDRISGVLSLGPMVLQRAK